MMLIRWFIRLFGVGLLVVGVSLPLAHLMTRTLARGWRWETVAMALLALGAFLILSLLTRPGVGPPGTAVGYDPRQAFTELMGRETSHTVTDYRPAHGGIEALTNMLPPVLAFVMVMLR